MRIILVVLIFIVLFSTNSLAGGHTITITETDVLCNSDCSGTATAIVTGGVGPFVYAWSNGGSGITSTGLCAATYSCTVTDNNDLSKVTATVIITEPPEITLSTSSTSVTCGIADGSATVNAIGGVNPYTYSWSNGAPGMTISGVTANGYTVTVTDSKNCSKTGSASISNSGVMSPIINKDDVLCNGGFDGSAVVFYSGSGTPPLSYLWSTGATGLTANSLSAGTYAISITDKYNCTYVKVISIIQPLAIVITISTAADTNGRNNGSASISGASGGTNTLSFMWSTSVQGQTITGLSCGVYSVTATDANGCTDTFTATVNCVTGINELNVAVDYSIYPNPAKDMLTIKTSISKPYIIQLINHIGETVYYTYETATGKTTIDVGALPKGIYIVSLTDKENNSMGRQRLVVQ